MGTLGRPGGCEQTLRGVSWARVGHTVRGSGGGFFGPGQRLVGGRRVGGSGGAEPPGRRRNFQKIFIKKPMENYHFRQIFQNFNENFAIFTKFARKIYRIFRENLGKM